MDYGRKWNLLLEDKRFREKSSTIAVDGRNPFENDYGRLVSSAPIRRLQDKTQVFPLAQSDYIRTRLTHSMEVSYIASSIGQSVEQMLFRFAHLNVKMQGHLSSLLRVAGLVHDLGNPPFGHFGEEAVQRFFTDFFKKNGNLGLSNQEMADFEHFDGNVQTFRILSKLYYFGDPYGYNLTYSSLASIIKYPSTSINGNQDRPSEIAKKKFGYFVTEAGTYEQINEYLELGHKRSPVVYLVEAADDIAYSAADIEDGVKLGIISIDDVADIFSDHLTANKDRVIGTLFQLKNAMSHESPMDESLAVQKFRIFTQQVMIEEVLRTFKEKYRDIMHGDLQDEIINISGAGDIRKAYKNLQYSVFDDKSIITKEIAGWEAIYGLLQIFCTATLSENFRAKGNNYEARLYKIVSSSHRTVFEKIEKYPNDRYKKLQLVTDFVSGMTDSYAINLYQELKGIKL